VNSDSGQYLVVDDEPDMCWALARILKSAGHDCQTAFTAKQAIAMAERQSFCLAFLDAKLANDDGFDLARRLRTVTPGIRIVIVSGFFYQDDPVIIDALQSGLISEFVSKPFACNEIRRLIGAPPRAPWRSPPAI
jgi:DNA-binding NtrC family response regulator